MKCQACNERKGSTRCEGCTTLFCLPCMNTHHDALMQEFQQLLHTRNEVKEAFDVAQATSTNEKTLPCLKEVDRWEREAVKRIHEVATKVRANIREVLTKNAGEVHSRLETLSASMQQQQKEGIYLENDIEEVKNQLQELKKAVSKMHGNIQVRISNNIDWDAMIGITTNVNDLLDEFDDYWVPPTQRSNIRHVPKRRPTKQIPRSRFSLEDEPDETRTFRPISTDERRENNRGLSREVVPHRYSNIDQNADLPNQTAPVTSSRDPQLPNTLFHRFREFFVLADPALKEND